MEVLLQSTVGGRARIVVDSTRLGLAGGLGHRYCIVGRMNSGPDDGRTDGNSTAVGPAEADLFHCTGSVGRAVLAPRRRVNAHVNICRRRTLIVPFGTDRQTRVGSKNHVHYQMEVRIGATGQLRQIDPSGGGDAACRYR